MKMYNLNSFKRGWYLGGLFEPTLYPNKEFEIALKKYSKGQTEESHYHSIATEFTLIVSGVVSMNETLYNEDSIIEVEPGEIIKFKAITDAICCVVKIPSCHNDKYIVEEK